MPETEEIVINTGPILALVAALGSLDVLRMYRRVVVPLEVGQEIRAGGGTGLAVDEFEKASWLQKRAAKVAVASFLQNTLDRGEAAVIQVALDEPIQTVCISQLTTSNLIFSTRPNARAMPPRTKLL